MYYGETRLANFKQPRKHKNSARTTRKDPAHLAWLHTLSCCVTGSQDDIIAHHLLSTGDRGTSQKAPDWEAVPMRADLHLGHPHSLHTQVPKDYTEQEWFSRNLVSNVIQLAERLYKLSGDNEAAEWILNNHRSWDLDSLMKIIEAHR